MKRAAKEFKKRSKSVRTEAEHLDSKQENTSLDQLPEYEEVVEQNESNCSSGRLWTVSIAVPFSIVDNAQSPALKAYLCGQVARAAAIFNVDEIIIFDEHARSSGSEENFDERSSALARMAKILQYLECPQYLRKMLFPLQKDLEFAGLLNPLDTFHHLKTNDVCNYREGVVTNKQVKEGKGSLVEIGLNKPIQVDKKLLPHIRVTVKFDAAEFSRHKKARGVVVSPTAPRTEAGLYWGYCVRIAKCLNAVLSESPFEHGYDLTIGTSERGANIDKTMKKIPKKFNHLLIVFGGLKGLEAALEADETLTRVEDVSDLFNFYVNTCPGQGSNTIRTEEAILITLSILRKRLLRHF